MNIAYLDITSWVGYSFEASHYYGKLKDRTRGKFLDNWIELERQLTAADIKAFNKEDRSFRYEVGDLTTRFNSEQSVIDKALSMVEELEIDVLYEGDPTYAEPQKIIFSNTGFDINKANEIFEKFDVLDWDKNEEEKEVTQKQWTKITGLKV